MSDISTLLAHSGRHGETEINFVNPPVYRGSTVLFPDIETMISDGQPITYGRHGNPTTQALASVLGKLDGANAAVTLLTPSGLSAISTALLSVLKQGDHVLVTDSVYGPTRAFCDATLGGLGIEATYFEPSLGAGISPLIKPNTRAIYLESPGSQSLEIQDIPAIASVARQSRIKVLLDNTWATPLLFRPLDHGVDLAIQSGTKYIIGHSDALLGVISANAEAGDGLLAIYRSLGLCVGSDDAYLALRGLRTLTVRLRQHQESALKIANWLETRPQVRRVLHPALPSHPGHDIWKRDYSGASGLFSFVMQPAPMSAVVAMLNGLRLFGLGYSFGGYESLVTYVDLRNLRTAGSWKEPGHLIRLQIGLENPDDLINDLENGFDRFQRAIANAA